jgi:hypothetical protein
MSTNPYINNQSQIPNANSGLQNVNPYINRQNANDANSSLFGGFDTQKFLIGAAVGAVGVYLLTNEDAQKTLFKTVAKTAELLSAGMEEMKERFEDAKAELEAQKEDA